MGPKEDEGTDLRAMLAVPKTNLPGAPTPLSGMRDAIGILFLGCAIGAVVARAISDDMSPILTALIVFASLIIVCSPLFWIRIAKPIVRAVNIERRNIEKRDAANAAAARVQEFDARLGRALDMADSEEGVLEVVRRALERQGVSTRGEFLLADSSNAHLERVAVASPDDAPGCSVDSPQNCPAVGRGQTTLFWRDDALDACPKLAGRSFGPCSAVCVPVTVMGRAAGVLHMIDQPDHVPSANDLDMLESLARLTGAQLGMLRAMEKTTRQAATDALTGLANRRRLEDVVRTHFERNEDFALAVADLDHFKDLNDTHGHEVGDRALRLFARTMRDAVRPNDLVSRYGGEEFVIVLAGAGIVDAVHTLERIRRKLTERLASGTTPEFTASFGIAHSTDAGTFDELFSLADQALLAAKRAGRDRIAIADDDPMLEPDEMARLLAELDGTP